MRKEERGKSQISRKMVELLLSCLLITIGIIHRRPLDTVITINNHYITVLLYYFITSLSITLLLYC